MRESGKESRRAREPRPRRKGPGFERVVGRVAVPAPVSFVLSGVCVIHDDAFVQVPVGDVDLVGSRIEVDIGRIAQVCRMVTAAGLAELAQLEEKLTVRRELEHQVPAAADPDVPFVIDVEGVLAHRVRMLVDARETLTVHAVEPGMTLVSSTPGANEVSLLVEFQDGRSRDLALVFDLVAVVVGGMQYPDVVTRIDGDAPHDTQPPLLG